MILWETKRIRKRKRGGKQRESYVQVRCPQCEQTRELTVYSAQLAEREGRKCRRCTASEKGKKGYAVTLERHGREKLLEAIQYYGRKSPTKPEKKLRDMLREMTRNTNLTPVFQERFRGWVLDFAIYDRDWQIVGVIECNGYWHQQTRQARDEQLRAALTVPVLFINADSLKKDFKGTAKTVSDYLEGLS